MNGRISPSRLRWPSGKMSSERSPRPTASADRTIAWCSARVARSCCLSDGKPERRAIPEITGTPRV